jgi:hypothetical protein
MIRTLMRYDRLQLMAISVRTWLLAWLATGLMAASPLAQALELWVDDANGKLGRVDVATGAVTIVGNMGVVMADIAFDPLGHLFGVSGGNLYSINSGNAGVTLIGSVGASVNSLVFSSSGTLYAANNLLYTINTTTGAGTAVGNTTSGFLSAGDLAFVGGELYLSSTGRTTDSLFKLNTSTGLGTRIGGLGVSAVYGLASSDGANLYAVSGTTIYQVNALTGATSSPLSFAGQGLAQTFGTTFMGEAAPVPEPGASALMLAGLAVVGFVVYRRRRE